MRHAAVAAPISPSEAATVSVFYFSDYVPSKHTKSSYMTYSHVRGCVAIDQENAAAGLPGAATVFVLLLLNTRLENTPIIYA